jgi:4-hydroxy-tetrahydrodipicolinate reductase
MGDAIISAAEHDPDVVISASIDAGDAIGAAGGECDVIVDFSHADATEEICATATAQKKPLVVGTTGQSEEQRSLIETAGATVPIVFASNFSIGVNVLFWLTAKAAELLGPDFDFEITETHHRWKKDAPSGTARTLAELLSAVRKSERVAHGREGMLGERLHDEIGVHSVRAGDVVGDHTVLFGGTGERLELTHRASSRATFATGALVAAKWVRHQKPGLYSMQDVLGLASEK